MTRLRPEQPPAIVWFHDDLRLADNEALSAACAGGGPVLCIYILDEASAGLRPRGGAARWWLHHSLAALGHQIAARGGRLDLFRGAAGEIVPALARAAGAGAAFWTRRYGRAEIAIDAALKAALTGAGIRTQGFKGQLLQEPWEATRTDGGGFRVFTAYERAARALPAPGDPVAAPVRIPAAPYPAGAPAPVSLAQLGLAP
jgi:deoxyribodipyrimidine photo-lyase